MLSEHMGFLRHIIGLVIALLFSSLSAAAMPMMPTASDHAEFFPLQQTVTAEHIDVHFAARAPPLTGPSVAFTGAAVAEYGNGVLMHGHETQVASLGFVASCNAPNRGFGSADEAFDAISDFRSTRTITDAQGGTGTVSITEINGQRYVGVNSTNFTEADRALSKQWEAEIGILLGLLVTSSVRRSIMQKQTL